MPPLTMMENNCYVYEHWRPDKGICFYVGKGNGRRANSMYRRNKHHQAIQNKLAMMGMCVEVRIVAHGLSEEDAFKIEIERITFWKNAGVSLANRTLGGGGTKGFALSLESRKRMAEKLRGQKRPQEVCNKISAARKGVLVTPEWRENISKAHKGKKLSDDTRKRLSLAKKGVKFTEEHKRKISESQKKRFKNPQVKEKFRLLSVGKVPSAEARMKMSIAAKNRHNREKLVAEGELTIAPAEGA